MTSEEPAIAVSAPATSPGAGFRGRQLRARQASRTDCARVRISASNAECSTYRQQDHKQQNSVNRGQQIIEHDAEAARNPTVGQPCRPGLPDVEDPEEQEGGSIR